MIIGIDASRYGHPLSTGVEWYSFHLLNELIPMLGREHNNEVRLYSPHNFKPVVDLPFNVKKKIMPLKRMWTTLRLSIEQILHPADILFVPSHTLPLIFPKKSIITIHDLAFKRLANTYTWFQHFMLNRATKVAVKRAWKIIVPSNATKNDLIELYDCNEEKIFVIPHGAPQSPRLKPWSDTEKKKFLAQFHLQENDLVILSVGRLETKKNLCRLIEAFHRFSEEFPDWKLFLAGKRGVGFKKIWKTVESLGLETNVVMPGYITEKEKSFLYSYCRMVAFPSLYEGFGLPVLEAFAHKRPILTSNITSLPEVAGNAAYLVNPEKVEEISVGLKRLASDGMLVSQLIQKGEQQLRKFNWEKAATATYEVIVGE